MKSHFEKNDPVVQGLTPPTLMATMRFLQERMPENQTALMASWLTLTSTPSGVTVNEKATAAWASAIPLRMLEEKKIVFMIHTGIKFPHS